MTSRSKLSETNSMLLEAWRTNARATAHLIENLPATMWNAAVPGEPRKTVRMIAAHFHNSRARWIRTLGEEHGIAGPPLVDQRRVTRRQLVAALRRSTKAMETLLRLGIDNGGEVPPSKRYVWRNLQLDVPHVLTYFVAHEGHHRGQLMLIGRQLGHRLSDISDRLWDWKTRKHPDRRVYRDSYD